MPLPPSRHPRRPAGPTTPPEAPARGRWWRVAYDGALLAFPRAFRARWGDDMRRTFADRLGGNPPTRSELARELHDVVASGLRERLSLNSMPMRLLHPQDIRYALRLLLRSPG